MLTFKIISLNGSTEPIECDSVHLILRDSTEGKGGGSMGVRTGHIKSLLSVADGKVNAYLNSKEIFSCTTVGGFATVEDDTVTLVTQKYTV